MTRRDTRILGFLVGALAAGAVLWVGTWLVTVTDEDRLEAALAEHCLPYVTDGVVPFQEIGRGIGVYDGISPDPRFSDAGQRLLYDDRFLAEWGELDDQGIALRVCQINGQPAGAGRQAFEVREAGLIPWIDGVLAAELDAGRVVPDTESVTDGPRPVGWFEQGADRSTGLRVVLTAWPGSVSSFIVAGAAGS